MLKNSFKNALIIVLLVLLAGAMNSCSWQSANMHSIEEYNKWLSNKSNGCIIENEIAGIKIKLKYLPPSYMVLKEIGTMPKPINLALVDSLLKKQKNMFTFLMTIEPDKDLKLEKRNSIMYEGVEDYGQYVQRVISTNFLMDNYISLFTDVSEYKPVLTNLENIYELSEERNFMVVFVNDRKKDLLASKDLVFVYNDQFFKMGKVQFDFSVKNIAKARDVGIAWN